VTPADYFKRHPDATKYCSQCKKELPITEFYLIKPDRLDTELGVFTACVRVAKSINARYVTGSFSDRRAKTYAGCPWDITDCQLSQILKGKILSKL